MRTALICTTINIPTVLSLYRAHDLDVRFFVAMDKKTPDAAFNFCQYDIKNTHVCFLGDQEKYKCSELIGWNTISRRNIALLEALKWGADVLISVDDDNICLDNYFEHFYKLWYHPPGRGERWYRTSITGSPRDDICGCPFFNGLKFVGSWFDSASLCFPTDGKPVVQRGFPQDGVSRGYAFEPVTNAKIGMAQGMILGNPDTSAIDRISRQPQVHQVSELLRAGIVTDPRETWAPLNSQNIAFIRELAPAFFMVPQWLRHDDIYASLICQRLMRERGYHVHYGRPFVLQERNPHNLLKDLRAEQWGAEHILDFTEWLDSFTFSPACGGQAQKVTDQMRIMFTNLPDWMPDRTKIQEMVLAWCEDCDKILGDGTA